MSYLDEFKKHIFVEETPKPVAAPPPTKQQVVGLPNQSPVPYVVNAEPSTNGSLYKKLLSRTDFDSTPTGTTLNKYLVPFASLSMPESMKLKAAVAQATAQEKTITAQGILSTFDDLKNSLQSESQKFDANVTAMTNTEITDRASKIADIDKQIATLQQQESDLRSAMFTAQGKIESAKAEFAAAVKRREQELDTQKESYRSQLQ